MPNEHVANESHQRPPEQVRSTTKVNVAFPFSKVTVREPSAELMELSQLVADFSVVLVELAPGPETERIRDRALALARSMT